MTVLHLVSACALCLILASQAPATLVAFSKLTNNAPNNLSGQLAADVSNLSGKVLFKISNAGPTASFIGQIYFDDNNSRLSNMVILDDTNPQTSAGVSFSAGATPANLPAGNTAVPAFAANFSAGADNPAPQNGVGPGTMVGITFDGTLANVLSDIANGALRIGLHVQGIGTTGNSDSYVSIPEPTCWAWLGTASLMLARRRWNLGCRPGGRALRAPVGPTTE